MNQLLFAQKYDADKLQCLGVFAQQPRGAPTGEVARVKAE